MSRSYQPTFYLNELHKEISEKRLSLNGENYTVDRSTRLRTEANALAWHNLTRCFTRYTSGENFLLLTTGSGRALLAAMIDLTLAGINLATTLAAAVESFAFAVSGNFKESRELFGLMFKSAYNTVKRLVLAAVDLFDAVSGVSTVPVTATRTLSTAAAAVFGPRNKNLRDYTDAQQVIQQQQEDVLEMGVSLARSMMPNY